MKTKKKVHTAYELLEKPGNFELGGSTLTEKEIKRFAESLPTSEVLIKVKWMD